MPVCPICKADVPEGAKRCMRCFAEFHVIGQPRESAPSSAPEGTVAAAPPCASPPPQEASASGWLLLLVAIPILVCVGVVVSSRATRSSSASSGPSADKTWGELPKEEKERLLQQGENGFTWNERVKQREHDASSRDTEEGALWCLKASIWIGIALFLLWVFSPRARDKATVAPVYPIPLDQPTSLPSRAILRCNGCGGCWESPFVPPGQQVTCPACNRADEMNPGILVRTF